MVKCKDCEYIARESGSHGRYYMCSCYLVKGRKNIHIEHECEFFEDHVKNMERWERDFWKTIRSSPQNRS